LSGHCGDEVLRVKLRVADDSYRARNVGDGFPCHLEQARSEITSDAIVGKPVRRGVCPAPHGRVGFDDWNGISASGVIVPQAASEDTGGFGIVDPLAHTFGIGEGREPFEQADEALALAPVSLAEGVTQVLAAGLRAAQTAAITSGSSPCTRDSESSPSRPILRAALTPCEMCFERLDLSQECTDSESPSLRDC